MSSIVKCLLLWFLPYLLPVLYTTTHSLFKSNLRIILTLKKILVAGKKFPFPYVSATVTHRNETYMDVSLERHTIESKTNPPPPHSDLCDFNLKVRNKKESKPQTIRPSPHPSYDRDGCESKTTKNETRVDTFRDGWSAPTTPTLRVHTLYAFMIHIL